MSDRDGTPEAIEAGRDAILGHVDRCWRAECENADRIESRRRLFGAAIVGLFGLGLFRFEWLFDPHQVSRLHCAWLEVLIRLCLVSALYFFARSLFLFYRATPENIAEGCETASELLSFEESDKELPRKQAVTNRTYIAYANLQRRNKFKWNQLRRGKNSFSYGFALVFVAIALYIIGSAPPKLSKEAKMTVSNATHVEKDDLDALISATNEAERDSSSTQPEPSDFERVANAVIERFFRLGSHSEKPRKGEASAAG